MRALLICPASRPAVAPLAEQAPLAALPLLGATLLEYWLVHLAGCGARDVVILASDRPAEVRRIVGDGARWGLRVEVVPAAGEVSVEAARARAHPPGASDWLPEPDDVVLLDHLPGLPDAGLFDSHRAWFAGVEAWMPRALTPDRVGGREIQPEVSVGLHSRIHPDAVLVPPCWIGGRVSIGAGATVGPQAVVEDRVVIEPGAEISRSIIGPETFVGGLAEIRDSIAWGDTLINWRNGSCVRVRDAFLLSPLREAAADQSVAKPAGRWQLSRRWLASELPPLRVAGQVLTGFWQHVSAIRDENRNA